LPLASDRHRRRSVQDDRSAGRGVACNVGDPALALDFSARRIGGVVRPVTPPVHIFFAIPERLDDAPLEGRA
jgi:hypothetical protein